jgi:hypothetical protein
MVQRRRMELSSEEVFATAVIWAQAYGELLNEVISAIDLPWALTVAKKTGDNMGATFVDGLKKMGGFTPEAMAKLIDQAYLPMGLINIENKVTPTSLVMTVGRCPIYEGFKLAWPSLC